MHEDVDISAYNGKHRPAFDSMMGRLVDVDAVVFWRLDRLARSVRQLEDIADACQAAKVQLVSTDGEVDTTSAAGRAFYQMRGVFGEFESRNLSERSRQMTAHKKARGEWMGRVPYGWRLVDKKLEPDPDQQAVLVQAAQRFVAGETFSAIARDLGFQISPLSRILHSERVQAVLPEVLAGDLARALVDRRWERTPRSRQSLLGGLARCGECGGGMSLSSTRADRQGRWHSYRCPTKGHAGIAGPWLDQFITEAVLSAVDTGRLVDAIKRRGRKPAKSRKASEVEGRFEFLGPADGRGQDRQDRFERMNSTLVDQLAAAQATERSVGVDIPAGLARNLSERWEDLPTTTRRHWWLPCWNASRWLRHRYGVQINPERVALTWRA